MFLEIFQFQDHELIVRYVQGGRAVEPPAVWPLGGKIPEIEPELGCQQAQVGNAGFVLLAVDIEHLVGVFRERCKILVYLVDIRLLAIILKGVIDRILDECSFRFRGDRVCG